jgi:hypothetical protein
MVSSMELANVAIFIGIGSAIGGNIGLMSATEHPENAIMGTVVGIALGAVFGLVLPRVLT